MSRYTTLFLCLTLIGSTPNASGALPLTGQELQDYWGEYLKLQEGQSGNWVKAGLFVGYVRGVLDALEGTALCLPESVSAEHPVKEVARYLQDHPNRNSAGRVLIFEALRGQFACRR